MDIDEDDLVALLEANGFAREDVQLMVIPADRPTREYRGLMLAVAQKGGVQKKEA